MTLRGLGRGKGFPEEKTAGRDSRGSGGEDRGKGFPRKRRSGGIPGDAAWGAIEEEKDVNYSS